MKENCFQFNIAFLQIKFFKMPTKEIYYSDKYTDETHEYRHVILPKVK